MVQRHTSHSRKSPCPLPAFCAHSATQQEHLVLILCTAEKECLFPPLTGLEVQSTRVDGTMLIIETRASVNLNTLTIEQARSPRPRAPSMPRRDPGLHAYTRGAYSSTDDDRNWRHR